MDDGVLSLKWNNHKTTFFDVLPKFLKMERHTDATIACEGKFYPVHQLVLSTCSDYFCKAFEKITCKTPVIILKDVRPKDFESLLKYMYEGEVDVRQADLSSLVKVAECLQIKGLAVPDDEHALPTKKRFCDPERSPSPHREKGSSYQSFQSKRPKRSYSSNDSKFNCFKETENIPLVPIETIKLEKEDSMDGELGLDNSCRTTVNKEPNENKTEQDYKAEEVSKVEHELGPGPSGMQDETSASAGDADDYLEDYGDESMHAESVDARTKSHFSYAWPMTKGAECDPHSEQKCFECSFCSYKSQWKWNLSKHLRKHTGERPFACPRCPYRAKQKHHLDYHSLKCLGKDSFGQ